MNDIVESPLVGNLQWAWDSTSIEYLKRCPRLYQYMMIEGWQSKEENIHLRFGGEVHQALMDYHNYRANEMPHDEAVHTVVQAALVRTYGWKVDEESKAGKYKNRNTLIRVIIDYLDYYEDDAAKTVTLADGTAACELSFQFPIDMTIGDHEVVLCGHLDRVADFLGDLYVLDAKTTTTTLGTYYFAQYEPNNQMSLYALAAKVILDAPIKGVIIDGIQIMVDSTRFVRSITYRTPGQLEEWLDDLAYWLGLAEHYAANRHWPQNDTACDKYGGCRFRSICSKDPKVREQYLKAEFVRGEPWNPLKPR